MEKWQPRAELGQLGPSGAAALHERYDRINAQAGRGFSIGVPPVERHWIGRNIFRIAEIFFEGKDNIDCR